MKRLTATTVVLGVLVFTFFIPVALLFMGGVVLVLKRTGGGIGGGAGVVDFNFIFTFRSVSLGFLAIILLLAAFISWLTQKILKRQNSRR